MPVEDGLPDQLVPAARIQRMFSITPSTLSTWVREGKVPAPVRVRNRTFFDPAEFRAFLDRSRQAVDPGGNAA